MINVNNIKTEVRNFARMLRWSFKMAKGERKNILLVSFCGMIEVFCGLMFVWASKNVIDIASKSLEGSLFNGIIILISVILIQIGFSSISLWIAGIMPLSLLNKIKHKLF